MEKYNDVLEKVAEKELYSSICWVAVLFLIIGIVWVSSYLYFKKMKNRPLKSIIRINKLKFAVKVFMHQLY